MNRLPSKKQQLDKQLTSQKKQGKKLPYKNPTHLAQQQEPWSQLSSTPTITSMRQDIYFFDPEIPKDDLDFRLAALYNHHTGTFKNKKLLPPPLPPSITSRANIRPWINPKKESIHTTNGGYSRKNDCGFFCTLC
ncbi:unnamed protein product [Nyctereutes procyonoides]|uniref:(raccoon dog) hypothetical protein n=1 Tax=Nyctereutes procyonoides TaxID=34880 RepID=A0A811YFB3_NYCPR|nr:unnamed protein product [Nyctereutes procyonoides]